MRLLSHHILREVLLRGALILGVVMALMLLAEGLELLEEMAHGEIPAKAVLALLGLAVPQIAALAFPLSLFFGLLTTVSRLCLDSEMDAMAAAGVGLHNFLPLVALLGAFGLVLESGLNLWAVPAGEASMGRAMADFQRQAITSLARPGQFNEFPGGRVLYFRKRGEQGRMRDIFFQDPGPDPNVTISAPRGELTAEGNGRLKATFWDGIRFQGEKDGGLVRVTRFERYRVHKSMGEVADTGRGVEALPTPVLLETAWGGGEATQRRTELYRRLAISLSLPVLLVLALPLGMENRRSGTRSYGILWGALLVLGYHNALIAVQEWAARGEVAPHWLLWAVPGPTLVLAAFLLYRAARGRRLIPLPDATRARALFGRPHEDR